MQKHLQASCGAESKDTVNQGQTDSSAGTVPTSLLLGHMEILKPNRLARLKDEYEYSWNGTYEKHGRTRERGTSEEVYSHENRQMRSTGENVLVFGFSCLCLVNNFY